MNIKALGQVFTPACIVGQMLALRKNNKRALEPSVGDGAFLSQLGMNSVGIEIDASIISNKRVKHMDFFDYPISNKFETIIGNPPYVRFQDIDTDTKTKLPMKLFDYRSNLYMFFIAKCVEHLSDNGELILITPRSFLKSTSAKHLNKYLYENGSFTHFYDLGDKSIFAGVSPNCAIWRWQKNRKTKRMVSGGYFCLNEGQIWFGKRAKHRLSDAFDIKVGAVSGADDVFANEKRGNADMVCSTTVKDGKTRKVIYNKRDESLAQHKQRLINRKIRAFNETNWWEWGRKYCQREGLRIYVNFKTRQSNPFFVSDKKAYDGSVLALFPKTIMDIHKAEKELNRIDWYNLGFKCDGRFMFSQRSLSMSPVNIQHLT